jgi:hypothetical protein
MSLVGSLEDLGLGDILQIVSLSRKSGLLLLRSEEGEGRIVFCDGLVRAAYVKGEAEDLRGLLLNGGFITEDSFDSAAEKALAHGVPIADILAETPDFSKERIESLRRERVERSVFRMFGWTTGEFSFEIRDDVDDRDRELLLRTGINAQYITMEATRIGDERAKVSDDDIEFGTIDNSAAVAEVPVEDSVSEGPESAPFASACVECAPDSEPFAEVSPEPEIAVVAEPEEPGDEIAAEVAEYGEVIVAESEADAPDEADAAEAEPLEPEAEAATAAVESATQDETDAPEARPSPNFASLVLIDPNLTALEWQKSVLGPLFRRIHIFQRSDGGISRIRQYLRRGEEPVVLVSDNVPGDPMSGIADPIGLIRRLRAHDPQMSIFLVQSGDEAAPIVIGAANGLLQRPADYQLANRRAWAKLEAAGQTLRAGLRNGIAKRPAARPSSGSSASTARSSDAFATPSPPASLLRLKRTSDRLRDPSVRGEVLSLILEFAAESFSRVAIFMVRDDVAVGMAESGLARADGPSGDAFREISIPADEPAWFRSVLQRREGIVGPPGDAGDRKLAALLGSRIPREVYVAPIESSHHVVALVYVDNLPGGEPIGETTALEIVLHEAGLALERALLERALADAADRDDA